MTTLGTLTLDLVAQIGGFVEPLKRAGNESKRQFGAMKKDAVELGKQIGLGLTVATGAVSAMVVSTVQAANQVSRLAAIANTSEQSFQRLAAGAQFVGIEQDKLADILKDVNDKVGDFLITGGGPLKDFFETIAPKIGVTAEQFRKLSGPESLQLFVSSLEKAGVSQKEMVFFMEAIASDATVLLPLLKNNGQAFKELGDQAAAAGAILDDQALRSAKELGISYQLLQQNLTGIKNNIATELIPALVDLTGVIGDNADQTQGATAIGEFFADSLKSITAVAYGAYGAVQLLGKAIGGLGSIIDAADNAKVEIGFSDLLIQNLGQTGAKVSAVLQQNIEDIKNQAGIVADDLDATAQELADKINKVWEAGDGSSAASERVKKITDLMEESRKAAQGSGQDFKAQADAAKTAQDAATKAAQQAADAAKQKAKAIADEILAMQQQVDQLGLGADAQQLYKLETMGASEAQLKQASALLKTAQAFEQNKKAQDDYKSLLQELRTEDEQLTDQMRERLKVLDAMQDITGEERARVASRIAGAATSDAPQIEGVAPEVGGAASEFMRFDKEQQALEEWYAKQLELLANFREERADLTATWDAEELEVKRAHEEGLAILEQNRQLVSLIAAEQTFGELAELAKTYAGEQSGIYKAMFAAQKIFAIAQSAIAIQQGIAQAAANPFPANIAAMATVFGATASIISNIQAIGMAHDGIDSVPKSGTWLLEKGERVTTANTSAKLDRTLERLNNQGMNGGATSIVINQPGVTNAREARESAAATKRAVAAGVAGARRYG